MITNLLNSPWKAWFELKMLFITPLVRLKLLLQGINLGNNVKFYGFPETFRHRKSIIVIGDRFENRNWYNCNPLGINHPTIFTTWTKNAQIIIGSDVGISGGCICASQKVEIGDGTLIGANCTIIDTDFHPIKSNHRRYDKTNIKTKPIKIGNNVFIGTNAIILKGANIADNSVIPAGAVVRSK